MHQAYSDKQAVHRCEAVGASAAAGPAAQAKSLSATERDETARARWRTDVQQIDPAQLVFVNECGTHTSMTRRKARAPRGMRARGAVHCMAGLDTLMSGHAFIGDTDLAPLSDRELTVLRRDRFGAR